MHHSPTAPPTRCQALRPAVSRKEAYRRMSREVLEAQSSSTLRLASLQQHATCEGITAGTAMTARAGAGYGRVLNS